MNLYIGDQEKGAAANPFPWEQIQKNKMAEMAAFNQQMELENNFQKEERAINAKIYENMQALNEKAIEFLPGDKQKFQAKYTELRNEFFKQVEPYSSVQAFYADGGAAKLSEFADNLLNSDEFGNGSHNAMQLKAYTQSLMTNPNTRPMQVVGKDGQTKFLAANEAIAEVMSGKADRFDFNGAYKTDIKMPQPVPDEKLSYYTWGEYINTVVAMNPGIDQNFVQDIVKMAGGKENLDKPSVYAATYLSESSDGKYPSTRSSSGGNGLNPFNSDYWTNQSLTTTPRTINVIDKGGLKKPIKAETVSIQGVTNEHLPQMGFKRVKLKKSTGRTIGEDANKNTSNTELDEEIFAVNSFQGGVALERDDEGYNIVTSKVFTSGKPQTYTLINILDNVLKSNLVQVQDSYAIIPQRNPQGLPVSVTTVAVVSKIDMVKAIAKWQENQRKESDGIKLSTEDLNKVVEYASKNLEFETSTFTPGKGASIETTRR